MVKGSTHKKSITQGYTFSSVIFNAYIYDTDKIKERLRLGIKLNWRNIDMLGFVDDIAIIANKDLLIIWINIEEIF